MTDQQYENVSQIHNASLEILEQTGIRLRDQDILAILADHGIRVQNEIAYFQPEKLMHWVAKAPSSFFIYGRDPVQATEIGKGPQFAPGYGAPMIMNADGTKSLALFRDYLRFLHLVQVSPIFNLNGGLLVQPNDLSPEESFPRMFYASLTESDQCLLGGAGGQRESQMIMDMLSILHGNKDELRKRPRVMGLISLTSPLEISANSLATMKIYAEYGQPMILTSAPMAGMTGPATLPGHLALANAEALAAIAVAQMLRPCTPVVYGIQGSNIDFRCCAPHCGSPDSNLIVKYCGLLGKYHHLPTRSGGLKNDSRGIDAQCGAESMLMLQSSLSAGINLMLHSAGIMDTFLAMSYEKYILDLEWISQALYIQSDLHVNENTLAKDLICTIGRGGDFLTSKHTLTHIRDAHWQSVLTDPNENLMKCLGDSVEKLIQSYEKPSLPDEIEKDLKQYLSKMGIRL